MSQPEVVKEVLPNGLTVLVDREARSPVVAINLWVRAGYFDETDSEIGISHVIEHMFFKGTPDRPRADQIAAEIKELGGELNAGTYYDSTHYYVVLPRENFRKGLEIQADALMHPLFDAEELGRELEAVIQEGRRKIDTPEAYAVEMMYREAFDVHRIRRWRIGTEEGLRAQGRDLLVSYFRAHYVPSRVIVSIAGDVEPAAAVDAAHIYLGGMRAAEGAVLGSPAEPAQTRFRHARLKGDIKRAQTVLGFHTPQVLSDDDIALRVLGNVLGGGRSSRLFQAVKERAGLVDGIGVSIESFQDLGILAVMAENDPKNGNAAVQAIQAEIERLRREPPSNAEIDRARAAIEYRYHQSRSDVLGRSSIHAYYEALGGYALAESMVRRLSQVTSAEVRGVAERYLVLENATLLEYLPEAAFAPLSDAQGFAETLRRAGPAPALPELDVPRAPAPPASTPPRISRIGARDGVVRHRFDSGPVLLHEERRDLPLVTMCVGFRGGRSGEARDNTGITRLMQSVMVKGSPGRNARQVALEIEALGSSIDRFIDEDYFGFSISILSRSLQRGAGVLMDVVRRPAFRHDEIERERALQLAAQETIKDQSMPYTFQLFRQAAFGSHPYALPSFGLQAPVQSLKREDLVKWHRLTVRPASMVIAMVGDIGEREAIDLAGAFLAEWIQEGHGDKDPGQLLAWGASEVVELRRRQQTAQVIGFPTPGLQTPERFPLDLVQAITSGLGGRFFEEVRGKRGLAYAVHAFNYHRVGGGAFAIYMATSPQHEAEARKVLFHEIGRLRRDGPRQDEAERAGRFLRGGHVISLQTNGQRAFRFFDAEMRGLGFEAVLDYPQQIASVGFEDIQDAIWRYLDPDHCAMGILRGDAATP